MKKLFLSISALMVAGTIIAQPQIDNSGLETWDGSGSSMEPVEWSSLKTSTGGVAGLAPQVCFQSTDAHSGTYSARLKSVSALGQVATGLMTNGKVYAEISGLGYVFTDAANAANNTALTDRPDSLVVWYKTTPQGQDFPGIEAIVHTGAGKIPENGTAANWVGTATWSGNAGTTISAWTRASAPFVYSSANTPAYILLAPAGGNGTSSVANTETLFDDFALIYNVTPDLSSSTAVVSVSTGYALTVNFTTPGTPVAATDFDAELSDASGSFASPVVIGTLNTASTSGAISAEIPAGTAAGTGYLIRVTNASPYYAPVTTGITVVEDNATAMAEANAEAVRVFAAHGILNVDLSGAKLERPTTEVFSVSGQIITAAPMMAGQMNRVDMSGMKGVFIVRVMDAHNIISKKVVIE